MKRKKLKAARKKASPINNATGSGDDSKPSSYTSDDLLDRAESLLEEESEVDAAQRFCLRALEMDDKNVRALRLIGILLLESPEDRSVEAKFCLERAVEFGGADIGHGTHLYLGQLTEGKESIAHYQAGILSLRKELEVQGAVGGSDAPKKSSWREEPPSWRLLSSAHCAIAEIFMTDLCDEDEAESECRGNLEAARTADQSNPEAINLWAAFHLVKQEPEVARETMVESLKLWQPALRAVLQQGEEEEEAAEDMEEKKDNDVDVTTATGLNFDARLKCSQTLVELGMLEEAAEVLESCHMENDEDVQVLYLSSVVHFKMWENAQGKEDKEDEEEKAANARTFLNSALEMARVTDQEEVVEHTQEMLGQLGDAGKIEENGELEPESSGDEEEKMEEG